MWQRSNRISVAISISPPLGPVRYRLMVPSSRSVLQAFSTSSPVQASCQDTIKPTKFILVLNCKIGHALFHLVVGDKCDRLVLKPSVKRRVAGTGGYGHFVVIAAKVGAKLRLGDGVREAEPGVSS